MAEQGDDSPSSGRSSLKNDPKQPLSAVAQHESGIYIEEGPFQSVPLIENLPSDVEYVQCEALDQNIYLGTSTGDLLHYFEIEPRNYMLVSQTKFNSDLSAPIDKIILLANIERALVLSNQTLVLFLLPEFAPAPNTPSLNGITDIALRGYSSSSRSYKLYASQAESIKLLKASSNAIAQLKKFDFDSVTEMVAQGHNLAVAKQNNYEIIDLKSSNVIPLFRVSETNAPLRPVVIEFKKREFLVATGGGSYDDSSMALVVNCSGDIVNATIVLDSYPASVIVEYPYLIVRFKPNRVSIYRLDDEPRLIQKIKIESTKSQISKTSKRFSGFKRPEVKERVVDMIRKVPVVGNANQLKVENEKVLVEESFEEESTTVIYGTFGIHVLIKPPPVLAFTEHNEPGMKAIEEYLELVDQSSESKFGQLENQYLRTLLLLLEILHNKTIDLSLIRKWCSALNIVDVRLLLYVLDFQIYGSLWIFNGLMDLIEKLKALKLYHKCDNLVWLLRTVSDLVERRHTEGFTGDYENIIMTLDVNMFKLKVDEDQSGIDIKVFHESSLEEILHIIESDGNIGLDLRLRVMQRRGLFEEIIELLKKRGEINRLFDFLKENIKELPPSYASQLLDDIVFIIDNVQSIDKKLISEVIELLSCSKTDPRELLGHVDKNSTVKVLMLQELGPEGANDKQFMLDYYMAKIQKFLQDDDVQTSLKDFVEAYSQDISYSKCSIEEFLIIKLKNNKRFRILLEYCETLKALCEQDSDSSLLKSALSELERFDVNSILTVLFLPQGKSGRQFMTDERMLDIYISFNDFMSIEDFLAEANIIKILKHYTSFEKRPQSLALVTKLLKRNTNLIRDEATFISVLKHLPSDYSFDALFDSLYAILKGFGSESRQLELQKALLKNQISTYNHFMKNIDMEELKQ